MGANHTKLTRWIFSFPLLICLSLIDTREANAVEPICDPLSAATGNCLTKCDAVKACSVQLSKDYSQAQIETFEYACKPDKMTYQVNLVNRSNSTDQMVDSWGYDSPKCGTIWECESYVELLRSKTQSPLETATSMCDRPAMLPTLHSVFSHVELYFGQNYPDHKAWSCKYSDWANRFVSCRPAADQCEDPFKIWNDKTKVCEPIDLSENEDNGKPCPTGGTNPINLATGNKYQSKTDYTGIPSLSVTRHYNSQASYDLGFGKGWSSSFYRRLNRAYDTIAILRPDGFAERFVKNGSLWEGGPDSKTTLVEDATGFTLTQGIGSIERYNLEGLLQSITNRQGQVTQYSYDAKGRLALITAPFGQTLAISYTEDWHIQTITDPNSKTLIYSYDDKNNLIAVINQDNKIRQYHYEDTRFPNALTGITDENQNRKNTWTYDDQGRAISSEHANGLDKHTLVFNNDDSVLVTNPLGKQTTYHFADFQGKKKVTAVEGHPSASCLAANKAYVYDTSGYLLSKTNWKGVSTTYTRDARGLALTKTEGAGTPQARTTTTEWHAQYRLPLRIIQPGKVIEFTYDAQGRQKSSTVRGSQ